MSVDEIDSLRVEYYKGYKTLTLICIRTITCIMHALLDCVKFLADFCFPSRCVLYSPCIGVFMESLLSTCRSSVELIILRRCKDDYYT